MAISSNTLFHFCDSMEVILSILSNGFYPSYCWEEIDVKGSRKLQAGVPMVSFCDLPLSLIGKHIGHYGRYGIGMTMSWGQKKGLNPVLYLSKDSTLAKSLLEIGDSMIRFHQIPQENKEIDSAFDNLYAVFQYVKNYVGTFRSKNGKEIKSYKFYDEREWRYIIPPADENLIVTKQEYDVWRTSSATKPLMESHALKFDPQDIKYLIASSEKEAEDLLQWIQDSNIGDDHQKRILSTRILTTEQIQEDF
ncbi:MAG: hypothetical protein JNL40_03035 [Cyclobacteriaceae bacterium]|nr:hypothetical protein [Cyclobacteriaceae bacterium]